MRKRRPRRRILRILRYAAVRGWTPVAGAIVARAYAAALGAETDLVTVLLFGVAVPVSEAVLMIVPAAVMWIVDRSSRRVMDGFAIGATGATALTATATVTLLL